MAAAAAAATAMTELATMALRIQGRAYLRSAAEHVGSEAPDVPMIGVAEVVEAEDVLDRVQVVVVVVGLIVDGARLDERRDQHRARPPAPRPVDALLLDVRPVRHEAAGGGSGLGLVERDDQQSILLEGGGVQDPGDPDAQERVDARVATRLGAVDARV